VKCPLKWSINKVIDLSVLSDLKILPIGAILVLLLFLFLLSTSNLELFRLDFAIDLIRVLLKVHLVKDSRLSALKIQISEDLTIIYRFWFWRGVDWIKTLMGVCEALIDRFLLLSTELEFRGISEMHIACLNSVGW